MRIDVRGAVMAAKKYFEDIQDLIGKTIDDILLEEVEISDDRRFWYVTLGFSRLTGKTENLISEPISFSSQYEREYKIFTIDADTGEVQSMKIREL